MFKKLIVKALSLGVPGLLIAFRNFKENYKLSKEPRIIGKGFKFIGNYAMMSGNFEPGETVIFEKILETGRCSCQCWRKCWLLLLYSPKCEKASNSI